MSGFYLVNTARRPMQSCAWSADREELERTAKALNWTGGSCYKVLTKDEF